MTEQFISLSEAESYTGKSRSNLRRFVDRITKADNHPDRHLIQPDPEEVAKLHKDNHPFSWKVSTELIDREYSTASNSASSSSAAEKEAEQNQKGESDAIDLLKKTVDMLQTELAEKNKQISQFQERDRETNVLLQQTTERLMLLSDNKKSQSNDQKTITVEPNIEKEEGSQRSSSDANSDSGKSKPKRESLWDKMRKPLFQR